MKSILAAALFLTAALHAGAAESVDELVARAAALDKALKAEEALMLYLQAEAIDPQRTDVLLGAARQYRHMMADANATAEKQRLSGLALKYAQRVVELEPNNPEGHLSVAITYAKRTTLESSREQVATSRLLRKELDRTLKLNPQSDSAWHLLGRWEVRYAELSPMRRAVGEALFGKLPVGSHETAAQYFERALEENPNRLMHYIELGRVYAAMGRTDEARSLLKKGLSMPNREKDDPESKKRGAEALAGLPKS